MSEKNVLIPLSLLLQIAELLDCWDTAAYGEPIQHGYIEVVDAIINKLQSIHLHNAYTKIVRAIDETERMTANAVYFKYKREYEGRV
jgi:hypothetical protein